MGRRAFHHHLAAALTALFAQAGPAMAAADQEAQGTAAAPAPAAPSPPGEGEGSPGGSEGDQVSGAAATGGKFTGYEGTAGEAPRGSEAGPTTTPIDTATSTAASSSPSSAPEPKSEEAGEGNRFMVRKSRVRELQELRNSLKEKEFALLQKQQELEEKEQTMIVLQEQVRVNPPHCTPASLSVTLPLWPPLSPLFP